MKPVVHIAARLLTAYFIALLILFGCYAIQHQHNCIDDGDHMEYVQFKFTPDDARNVNLFYRKRSIDPVVTTYIKHYITKELRPISFFYTSSNLLTQLTKSRVLWEAKYIDVAYSFWTDVYWLTYDFLSFWKSKSGMVHLGMIGNNAYTKFPTDRDKLRLFTTYDEKGMAWVPEKAVNRFSVGINNGKMVKGPAQI